MNVLAQVYDARSLGETALFVIAIAVLIGIVLNIPFVQKNISWVPSWVWSVLGLVALVVLCLWALRSF